jgi:molybdopterin/thiamine biosynthesis adenylyltransferase
MDDRYSRQELFEMIGKTGQKKISSSVISIIGCGALGSNSAEIMARAGVKKIILVDYDNVELSNLQRQALYTEEDVRKPKTQALENHLKKINSTIEIETHNVKLTETNTGILKADIILDGTDNFKTRFIVNNYAVKNNIPFVFASTIKSEGMVYPVIKGSPCLNCMFDGKIDTGKADQVGIIASAAKTASSIQSTTALKIIVGENIKPELIKCNLWNNEFLKLKPKKNINCKICN